MHARNGYKMASMPGSHSNSVFVQPNRNQKRMDLASTPNLRLTYLKLLLTAIFWGGTFIAGKIVARNMGPFSAAFLRFLMAALVLLLLTWQIEGSLPLLKKRQIPAIVLLGMTGIFAYNFFFFTGLKMIEASRAALIIATNPIFISLLSALFFKEKLNGRKVTGILLSVLGAVVVISKGHLAYIARGGFGWGELAILGCVFSWVSYSLIGKAVMNSLSPLVSVTYSSVVGVVALFAPAYSEGLFKQIANFTGLVWLSLAYLGLFGTVLGFLWYYEGIKHIGPGKASQFINFVPISAILLAFLLLGEPITLSLLVGGLFVITGVYLTKTEIKQSIKMNRDRPPR